MPESTSYTVTVNMERFAGLQFQPYEDFRGNTFAVPWSAMFII